VRPYAFRGSPTDSASSSPSSARAIMAWSASQLRVSRQAPSRGHSDKDANQRESASVMSPQPVGSILRSVLGRSVRWPARYGFASSLLGALAGQGLLPAVAHGHDPATYPAGGSSVYAGLALGHWQVGMSGQPRDPSWIASLPVFAARALDPRWRLEGGVALVASGHRDRPQTRPCPSEEDGYCQGLFSVGALEALLSRGSNGRRASGSLGLGWRGDPWNAHRRQGYLNVGQGATGGLISASAQVKGTAWRGVAEGELWAIAGRWSQVPFRVPSDSARGRLTGEFWAGAHLWRAGCTLEHRALGVDYGPTYLRDHYPTKERWSVVQFAQARVEAGWSLRLNGDRGLHLSASAPLWTRNGPPDLLFAQVGAHQWRARTPR
jgi:hypothetical protein